MLKKKKMIKWIRDIANTVALLTLLTLLLQPSSAALAASGFCGGSQLKDYLQPLKRLPDVRHFSPSGRLGVGPSALRVYPATEHLVPIAHGFFEVRVGSERSISKSRIPEWEVTSALERITSDGNLVALMGKHERQIRTVDQFLKARFSFQSHVPQGLYRLSFEIRNSGGKRLQLRQEYFRVMAARSKLKLTMSDPTLHPGEVGKFRPENLGTVPASYGYQYKVVNSLGESIPDEFGVPPAVLLKLQAGFAGLCVRVRIPMGLPPGKYRIQAQYGDRLRSRIPVSAEFYVEG